MKKIFFPMFFILIAVSLAYGAQKSRIELNDGNTVDGEIVSVVGGKYTVKTQSLGTLQIEDAKVVSITDIAPAVRHSQIDDFTPEKAEGLQQAPKIQPADGPFEEVSPSFDEAAVRAKAENLQASLMQNPEFMAAIPGLLASPDFQAIMKDPEVMRAAQSMDLKTLMANKKFMAAASNPMVQEISRKADEKSR